MMIRIGNFFFRYRNGLFPLVFVLMFLGGPRLFPSHALAVTLGLAVALLGQLLRAVTIGLAYIKRGGRQRQVYADTLVQDGVFTHCRNPLYVGNFLVIVGLGLVSNSRLFFLLGIPFFIFAYAAIIAAEENFLRKKFGAEFDAYCRRVGRLIPDFSGFGETWRGMEFKWRRLIIKEHGSTYAWMATAWALLLQDHWLRAHTVSDARMQVLWGVFALITMAYLVVRYFKKCGTLVAD